MSQVFEKNLPALVILNSWFLRPEERRFSVGLGLSTAFAAECKTTTTLFLMDVSFGVFWEISMTKNLWWYVRPGLGFVGDLVKGDETVTDNTFSYLNYELATGLQYRFRRGNDVNSGLREK